MCVVGCLRDGDLCYSGFNHLKGDRDVCCALGIHWLDGDLGM